MTSGNQPNFSGATSVGGAAGGGGDKARDTSQISRLNPNQLKN